jgi:arylsulfatase A-like enzyme
VLSVGGLLSLFSVLSLVSASSLRADGPPQKPNIIFVLADDLGYGDLGIYGQNARAAQGLPAILTPRIDQLAQQGIMFNQFYATPACAPTRCTLYTGFHKGHSSIRCNSCSTDEPALRREDITVAEMLKRAGYRTSIVGKWHKGPSAPAYAYSAPQNKGFDESYVFMDDLVGGYYPEWLWRNGVKEYIPENAGGANNVWSQDLYTQEALRFISENANRPFYLQVAYNIPHANLECPSNGPYADKPWPEIEKRFAATITLMDTDVGRIIDLVDQLGMAERTLIIFTSDNGPQNKEGHSPEFFNSNSYLRGIKFDFWEGGIRVPFIARWTGRISPGATSEWIGALYDFMPTAAEMAGIKAPGGVDGLSFLPTLLGNHAQQAQHAYMYVEGDAGGQRTVRMGKWKAVSPGGVIQLYDLSVDPSEQNNVAGSNPSVVAQISQIHQEAHRDGPPPVISPVATLVGGDVSGSGSHYTINFGTLRMTDAPVIRSFQVRNDATTYSNLMEGSIVASGVTDARIQVQIGTFAWLVDGSSSDTFTITFTPSAPGTIVGQSVLVTARKYGYAENAINAPITIGLAGQVQSWAKGDFDNDGDVDQEDFGVIQQCYSGPQPGYPEGCQSADFNGDSFVDTWDSNEFLSCMSRPNQPSPCQ